MAFKMKGFPQIQSKQSKETKPASKEATADPAVGQLLVKQAAEEEERRKRDTSNSASGIGLGF